MTAKEHLDEAYAHILENEYITEPERKKVLKLIARSIDSSRPPRDTGKKEEAGVDVVWIAAAGFSSIIAGGVAALFSQFVGPGSDEFANKLSNLALLSAGLAAVAAIAYLLYRRITQFQVHLDDSSLSYKPRVPPGSHPVARRRV
jgi:hypothetical protein